MDWKTLYHQRTMSAPEAVGRIRSGDRVVVMHACGEPSYLLDQARAILNHSRENGHG